MILTVATYGNNVIVSVVGGFILFIVLMAVPVTMITIGRCLVGCFR